MCVNTERVEAKEQSSLSLVFVWDIESAEDKEGTDWSPSMSDARRHFGRGMGDRGRREGHGRTRMWNVDLGVTQMPN